MLYATNFLGGMNAGFSLLSLLCLRRAWLGAFKKGPSPSKTTKNDRGAKRDVLYASSLAHLTQWYYNVGPFLIVLNGKQEELPMRWTKEIEFIFAMDFIMFALNLYVAQKI